MEIFRVTIYRYQLSPVSHEPLRMRVHYGKNYANAYWDGAQMVLGDGVLLVAKVPRKRELHCRWKGFLSIRHLHGYHCT